MVKAFQNSKHSLRIFTLLSFALAIAALYFAKEILLPIALAILLSFVLSPIASRFERWGMGRVASVVAVTSITILLIGSVVWLSTHQVIHLSEQLPTYKDNMIEKIRSIRGRTEGQLADAKEAIEDIGDELTEPPKDKSESAAVSDTEAEHWLPWPIHSSDDTQPDSAALDVRVVELPPSPMSQIKTWLGPLVAPFSTLGIVIVLVIFILLKREDLRNRVLQLFGTSRLYMTTGALDNATRRLSRYLQMQLLINASYGLAVGVSLALIGVPNALLWGVFGMMLRFLPYLGPWIAAAMPILLSLAVSDGWIQPLLTTAVFIVLEILVNNVLEPWLYGSSTGVSSMGVILAAIFWAWIWGPIGLVVAMPLTVCLIALGKYVPQLKFLPILLGDETSLRTHEQMYQRLLTSHDHEAIEIAERYLETHSLTELYEQVIVPALHSAELDRHADRLSEQQEQTVNESARELVEHLAQQADQGNVALSDNESEVVCLPVRDHADETTAIMIEQALESAGFATECGSLDLLVGEMIELTQKRNANIVVISVLPPLGSRNARYFCKRLRQSCPALTIIVSLFGAGSHTENQKRLLDSGADSVVTSLRETVEEVRRARQHARCQSKRNLDSIPEYEGNQASVGEENMIGDPVGS